ncbi:hypothetical protein JRO89_XS09G0243800 [Xanthoceras sorbifolium]|uniref:L-ascorbate oxidase homolog n=1 Tax=Xanthoceras sorbifolium TaxID=99658 RepID=A0ABQ8HMU4_9ROSI|nr:hypothetical protein JRO89_XS09G0243800 [Xanthoceras sorbifolium]
MAASAVLVFLLCLTAGALTVVRGEDPYLFYTWDITYGTISPLGVPQQVILINGQFPGPTINSTTNNNVIVNVFNKIDEPFLLTWSGIQHRKNSWQDGVPGTMCPIQPGTNYTYHFQVKDQIGTYMYYPSTGLHRAAGAFGGLNVHSRSVIPVPYDLPLPENDFYVLINDWYTKSHSELRKLLDSGRTLARPQGVLINGKSGKPDGSGEPLFTLKSGLTYKLRICNPGLRTSINFRIQDHNMKLVEMEGSHVVQNMYESLDVHVGQCYSVLVEANKEPKDYYMVASSRFLKGEPLVSTALIRYEGGKGPASSDLPKPPVGWAWSLNQFRTLRWNLTASAARPNPQGSYHYGEINITRTFKFVSSANKVDGKLRYAINGISHVNPTTPPKFAEYYMVPEKVFKYDIMPVTPPADKITQVTLDTNILNMTFHDFVEIIFENHENTIQSWKLDGFSFFAVAIEPGKWTPEKRRNYNLQDAVSRHTIQVFPKSWAAILLTFDNAGMWNIRSEMTERTYLGQQLYVSVYSPRRSLKEEYNIPDNAPLCGIVADMPKPEPYNA